MALAQRMRWGLIPYFAKGEPPRFSTINARIETAERPLHTRGLGSASNAAFNPRIVELIREVVADGAEET